MGKQNKRVKAEAEDEVIFNTELKNKKQKKDKQQAVGYPNSEVKNERVEVKAEDVVTPNTEQKNQQQKKEKQQAVGGKINEVKAEPDSAVANAYTGPVAVSDNASKGGPRKKKETTQINEKELAKKNVPDHVVESASNGAGKKRKRNLKKKHQAVGDPNNKVKIERDGAQVQGDVPPNTEQQKKQQQQKKEKQQAVGGKNNEVKAGPDSTVANVYNGPVTVSDNNASKRSLKKKKEKTQIKEKELAKKNVPDHVVEPASNGAGKKRKRKQKKKHQAVGDPNNKVKIERVEAKVQGDVTPNTEQKKKQQQQKKEKQQDVGGKNNEVKAEPDSTFAHVYNGPVTVSDNASKGSLRKKKERTQIKEKELAKKNVLDHVVEPASNGAGKKRKRKQKKKHPAVGDPNNKVKSERVEVKDQGDVTPNTEQKKQQQQKKEKQQDVGGKNNEVKAGPDSTVANVYKGPVTVSDNPSKGSLRKKKEKTQIKEKELAKKNVPDHVVELASNGAGKKRKRKQSKMQEVANENSKINFVEKGSSGTEDQIREGFEAATDCKTIVVSGLPFDMKSKKILDHFKDCGFITQIGRSTFSEGEKISGLIYIEFETEDAAKRAVGLDGTKLRNISFKVELSKVRPKKKSPPAKISGCKIAYIGNLPRVVKEDDIRQFFKDSKIESINLALYNRGSRRCRGFGGVLFADDESLENAMKNNTVKLYDRPIKVAYANEKFAESKKKTKVQDV